MHIHLMLYCSHCSPTFQYVKPFWGASSEGDNGEEEEEVANYEIGVHRLAHDHL